MYRFLYSQRSLGHSQEAVESAQRVMDLCKDSFADYYVLIYDVMDELALSYKGVGRIEEAVEMSVLNYKLIYSFI